MTKPDVRSQAILRENNRYETPEAGLVYYGIWKTAVSSYTTEIIGEKIGTGAGAPIL